MRREIRTVRDDDSPDPAAPLPTRSTTHVRSVEEAVAVAVRLSREHAELEAARVAGEREPGSDNE